MALAWASGAWIAGTAAAATLGASACGGLALAIAALSATVYVIRRERRALVYAMLLPALFALGAARYHAAAPHLAPDAAARFSDGVDMRVRGVLRDDPDIGDTSQRFAISVRAVQVRGEWTPASGGVLVRTGLLPRYRSGDVLELEGKLQSPPHIDGFDYADYLQRRGIASVMESPAARRAGHEDDGIARATVLHVRRTLSHGLALSLPEPQASLAQGVLLGQRSALPADVAADLNTTNTSHLVVVSGTNIVYVSTYATTFFLLFGGRRRALMLSIAAILAYASLIGFSPPVVRALIMGVLMVFARVSGGRSSAITALSFAAAIMVAHDPRIVRDVSFQLSFAATAGILSLSSPARAWIIEAAGIALRLDEVPRWMDRYIAEPLAMTLAAIVATSPLLALNFGRLSLVAVPANLLVVPAFPLILGASLVSAVGGLFAPARLLCAAPAYYVLTYWLEVARWFAALPHAAANVDGYSAPWAAATYASIATVAALVARYARRPQASRLAESRPLDARRLRALAMFGVPVAVLAITAGFVLWPSHPARLRLTVLDVGQGDAILIRTPAGHDILVDGGPGRAVLRGLGDELPWYDRSIDMLLLTHPQGDHLTGLLDVLARYDVGRVLAGPGVQDTEGYRAWIAAVSEEGVRIETVTRGQAFDLGDGVRLEVLGPDATEAAGDLINNTSAVVRITWHEVSFLLTGDIEAKVERDLLADGINLQATVLKVAHHGSATSSSAAFLEAVHPQFAVVSSGRDNPFGHPAAEVVARLDDYAAIYNTAESGAVTFETDGHRLRVTTAR